MTFLTNQKSVWWTKRSLTICHIEIIKYLPEKILIWQTWLLGFVTRMWQYWDWLRDCVCDCMIEEWGGAQVHSSAKHPEPEPINYLMCHLSAAIRAPLVDWYYVRLRLSDRLSHSVCWRVAWTGCSLSLCLSVQRVWISGCARYCKEWEAGNDGGRVCRFVCLQPQTYWCLCIYCKAWQWLPLSCRLIMSDQFSIYTSFTHTHVLREMTQNYLSWLNSDFCHFTLKTVNQRWQLPI